MENFSAKDIVQIIRACTSSSVKSLKIGELELTFLDKCDNINQNLSSVKLDAPMKPGDIDDINYTTLTDEEKREMLILNDPNGFERELHANQAEEAHITRTPSLI